MPFAWAGVQVHAAGGAALRVRLARAGAGDGLAVHAAAPDGTPVLTAGSLVLRPVTAAVLDAARGGLASALFTIDWVPLPAASPPAGQWAVIGSDALAAALAGAGAGAAAYPDLPALRQAIAAGAAAPDMVAAARGRPCRARRRRAATMPRPGRGPPSGTSWAWSRTGWPRPAWPARRWCW